MSFALLVLVFSNVSFAAAVPPSDVVRDTEGKIVRVKWEMIKCVDTREECSDAADDESCREYRASDEGDSCPNTKYACYCK